MAAAKGCDGLQPTSKNIARTGVRQQLLAFLVPQLLPGFSVKRVSHVGRTHVTGARFFSPRTVVRHSCFLARLPIAGMEGRLALPAVRSSNPQTNICSRYTQREIFIGARAASHQREQKERAEVGVHD